MPTQEYAVDTAGKSRVQVYRDYEGGDLTVLLDRVIVGSVLTEENGERNREIPLKDGSVLKVQVLEDQIQVLKNGEVLPPVPPPEPEKIKARRPEGSSRTMYVLGHPTVDTFDEEVYEATWSGVWGRISGYTVMFLVIGALPIITHAFSAFSPVYLLAIIGLAVIFSATVTALTFLVTGIPYFLARQLGGKAKFMEHSFLLTICLMPLVIFPFVIPLIGVLYQVYNNVLNSTQLSANLASIQTVFQYVLIPLSIYYFVLAVPAIMSVHKLRVPVVLRKFEPGSSRTSRIRVFLSRLRIAFLNFILLLVSARKAVLTAFVSLVLIWLAVIGLAFSGYLVALANFYFQVLPK